MIASARAILPMLLVAGMLGGCGRGAPIPTDTYYRLAAPRITAEPGPPLADGGILVEAFEADALYRERPLLFSEDAANLTLKQYHHHHWQESPPRLLREQLVLYLRAAHAAPWVAGRADQAPAMVVRGRIRRFEHIIGADAVTARVALELQLLGQDGEMLMLRDYQRDEPAAGKDVASVVAATDAALNSVFEQFLADARAAVRAPATGRSP